MMSFDVSDHVFKDNVVSVVKKMVDLHKEKKEIIFNKFNDDVG